MRDFVACIGDVGAQEIRYEHGERFIQYCLAQGVSAATATGKVQPEANPYVLAPVARYEHIRQLRRAGRWTVDKGRSPLSKFCHHFNKIRRQAGIEASTFHDLRRTCLSNWVARGLSLHEAKELAGQAGIETTERFYPAVRADLVDRARAASEASRKGQCVTRLLCAPEDSDKGEQLRCTSAFQT